jgi:hypothetical protein
VPKIMQYKFAAFTNLTYHTGELASVVDIPCHRTVLARLHYDGDAVGVKMKMVFLHCASPQVCVRRCEGRHPNYSRNQPCNQQEGNGLYCKI